MADSDQHRSDQIASLGQRADDAGYPTHHSSLRVEAGPAMSLGSTESLRPEF
jgi:hypothetical protein